MLKLRKDDDGTISAMDLAPGKLAIVTYDSHAGNIGQLALMTGSRLFDRHLINISGGRGTAWDESRFKNMRVRVLETGEILEVS